jgi:hypothetical protein
MVQTDRGATGREAGAGELPHPPSPDRRASERYTVLDHRGWLGQWGKQGFEVVEVRLLDLSRGGALLEMEKAPIEHQSAVLGLETLRETWCLEVKIVQTRWGRRNRYRVHVAFTETCPDEFFAAALNGPGTARPAAGTLA